VAKNLVDAVVDNVFMKLVGNRVIMVIRRRTLDGKFLSGSSEGAEKYSGKPFAMPYAAANIGTQNKISQLSKNPNSPNAPQIFTSAKGTVWVLITGGYKQYRELGGRDSSKVNLTWSGRMMRNLGILPGADKAKEVSLGFTSTDEKQKAVWHNLEGAGKSRRLHKFMGLTDTEKNTLSKWIGSEAASRLDKMIQTEWNKQTV